MSDLFLTDEELVLLTGYRQHSRQVQRLRDQRIPFHTNRAGHPRVTRAAVEGRRVSGEPKPKAEKPTWSPSWAASPAKT